MLSAKKNASGLNAAVVRFLFTFLSFLMLCCLAFVQFAHSAPLPDIKIYTEDFPPFNYLNDGQVKGIGTEILQQIFHHAELPFDRSAILVHPWARAYKTVKNTKNTLLYSIVLHPKRKKDFYWIGPIAYYSIGLFTISHEKNEKHYEKENFNKIAAINSSIAEKTLLSLSIPRERIHSAYNSKHLLRLLKGKRVEAIAGSIPAILLLQRNFNVKGLTLQKALGHFGLYLALNKETPATVVRKLTSGYQKMLCKTDDEGNNELQRISLGYTEFNIKTPTSAMCE